jgi:hypothetical protein
MAAQFLNTYPSPALGRRHRIGPNRSESVRIGPLEGFVDVGGVANDGTGQNEYIAIY